MIKQILSDSQTLAADIGYPPENDEDGLAIYARNRLANAERALAISLPTVSLLLGAEGFSTAVALYLPDHPLHGGDWGTWGEHFADWLGQQEDLADFAYIQDCARLDWQCHLGSRAADSVVEFGSLDLLAQVDAYSLYLKFHPAVSVLSAAYPLYELWQAHHAEATVQESYWQQAQQKLALFEQKHVMVYRPQWRVLLAPLSVADFLFVESLLKGQSLGVALDTVADTDFSFEQWLVFAIQHNVFSQWLIGEEI
jgi:hypothetical protein